MHSDDENRIDVDHNYESIYGKKEIDLNDGSIASTVTLLKIDLLNLCSVAARVIGFDAADNLRDKARSYIPERNRLQEKRNQLLEEIEQQGPSLSALGEQFNNAGSDEALAVHQKATESFSIKQVASATLDALTAPFREIAKIESDEVEKLEAEDEESPKAKTPKPNNNNNNIM